ncbi:DUF3617 domain-containing protein, partial [Pseudomonas syringae pv. tagetis]
MWVCLLGWLFCLASPLAHAVMLQPGLWVLRSCYMMVDGHQLPVLKFMLG